MSLKKATAVVRAFTALAPALCLTAAAQSQPSSYAIIDVVAEPAIDHLGETRSLTFSLHQTAFAVNYVDRNKLSESIAIIIATTPQPQQPCLQLEGTKAKMELSSSSIAMVSKKAVKLGFKVGQKFLRVDNLSPVLPSDNAIKQATCYRIRGSDVLRGRHNPTL